MDNHACPINIDAIKHAINEDINQWTHQISQGHHHFIHKNNIILEINNEYKTNRAEMFINIILSTPQIIINPNNYDTYIDNIPQPISIAKYTTNDTNSLPTQNFHDIIHMLRDGFNHVQQQTYFYLLEYIVLRIEEDFTEFYQKSNMFYFKHPNMVDKNQNLFDESIHHIQNTRGDKIIITQPDIMHAINTITQIQGFIAPLSTNNTQTRPSLWIENKKSFSLKPIQNEHISQHEYINRKRNMQKHMQYFAQHQTFNITA